MQNIILNDNLFNIVMGVILAVIILRGIHCYYIWTKVKAERAEGKEETEEAQGKDGKDND